MDAGRTLQIFWDLLTCVIKYVILHYMIKTQLNECIKNTLKFPDSDNIQQRGIADKLENACNEIIKNTFGSIVRPAKSRRSIEDINIGNTYVDHKSSDAALDFKMPNMISIDRLKKLDRELIYNFIVYDSNKKQIINTFALNVYELNWEHLKIQNLGKGQLQIANMVEFLKSPKTDLTKEQWLDKLKQEAIVFYKKVQRDAEKRQQEWQTYQL
jgi:hypothetical protein